MKNTVKTMAMGIFAVACLGQAAAANDLTVYRGTVVRQFAAPVMLPI